MWLGLLGWIDSTGLFFTHLLYVIIHSLSSPFLVVAYPFPLHIIFLFCFYPSCYIWLSYPPQSRCLVIPYSSILVLPLIFTLLPPLFSSPLPLYIFWSLLPPSSSSLPSIFFPLLLLFLIIVVASRD